MTVHTGQSQTAPPDGTAWDLLVIGGGTAGIVAARTAAGFGASVLLVERDRTGGDCLWTGCVPSKALLAAAHAAADARSAGRRHGVFAEVRVDGPAVLDHVRQTIQDIEPDDSPETLRAAGMRVVIGEAALAGPGAAQVDGHDVPFRQALIATGAAPALPDVPGLAGCDPLTSETVWDLADLPGSLLVLGASSIGCELGQAFAELGTSVTLVEAGSRILPREDADAASALHDALTADGVDVRTGADVTAAHGDAGQPTLTLADGTVLSADRLLVATGRHPRTQALGLAAAGVDLDETGHVRTDERLRTSNRRIWAAGDVTARSQHTHTAGVHGSLVAGNAVLGLRRTVDDFAPPRVTFTQPEVAAVGATTAPRDGSTYTVRHEDIDRGVTDGRTGGFSRLTLDRRGHVIGATIVGPRAGESLAEVALAVRKGLRARDVAASTHAYPTYGDGVWNAAVEQVRAGLARAPARQAIGALVTVRRRWVTRGR